MPNDPTPRNPEPGTRNTLLDNINIKEIITIAKSAGDAIMEIYNQDFQVEYKDDNSPLTAADLKSNDIITNGLQSLFSEPGTRNPEPVSIPILSEEGKEIPYEVRKHWEYFWLIDPIDGTKEFIKKNGEFTVNIALIHKDTPVLGVVYAPALGDMYYAKKGSGAWKAPVDGQWSMVNGKKERLPIVAEHGTRNTEHELVVVASKSHLSKETEDFIDALSTIDYRLSTISKGSSLKLVMVAEGSADIYPRLAPTMEWDTAAADAIVRESGKMTYQYDQTQTPNDYMPLKYNKENLLNPWFIVQ